jgi:Asp-tRNA(Asn)/Glu-tRNA(Gln) amidotransferase A subunit family amidase
VVERVLDAGATILGNAVWREPVLLRQQPPMARSMHDVALLLQTIPGTDVLDPRQHGASAAPTTWDARRRSRRAALAVGARGLRAAHAFETEVWSPPPPCPANPALVATPRGVARLPSTER